MRPKFSVVIATYNRTPLLRRALASLIAQTETDWDAWVVDDGGTDDTEAMIGDQLQKAPAIRYIRRAHGGEAHAKNEGIALCRGEFITFLDSDDEYEPDHLQSRRRILEQDPGIEFLHGGVRIVGDPCVPDRNDTSRQIHLSECVIGGTFFIRHDAMHVLGEFREIAFACDAELFDRAVAAGLSIVRTTRESYVYHREHADSITHDFRRSRGKGSR